VSKTTTEDLNNTISLYPVRVCPELEQSYYDLESPHVVRAAKPCSLSRRCNSILPARYKKEPCSDGSGDITMYLGNYEGSRQTITQRQLQIRSFAYYVPLP